MATYHGKDEKVPIIKICRNQKLIKCPKSGTCLCLVCKIYLPLVFSIFQRVLISSFITLSFA